MRSTEHPIELGVRVAFPPRPQDTLMVTFTTVGSWSVKIRNFGIPDSSGNGRQFRRAGRALLNHRNVTAGFFYKNLSDPIVSRSFVLTTSTLAIAPRRNLPVTQPLNAVTPGSPDSRQHYLQHI